MTVRQSTSPGGSHMNGRKTDRKKAVPRSAKPGHEREQHMMMMAMPESFAEMLRFQPEIRRRLKLPPWLLFVLPYQRKDQASLTELEQERFLCAFNVLNNNGTLG